MRFNKSTVRTCVALLLTLGLTVGSLHVAAFAQSVQTATTVSVAVGPQYDTTHVYVAPEDFDRFVASLIATFGGTTTKQGVFTVTPTQSSTMSQLVLTPVGTVSAFGFKTPIPYPFGSERTGYLVTDMDEAIHDARATGADVLVAPFNDPIGQDAIHSMARRYKHSVVLAHHCAVLYRAPDNPGESCLCVTRQGRRLRAQLSCFLPWDGRV
jgi:hypothetical protein